MSKADELCELIESTEYRDESAIGWQISMEFTDGKLLARKNSIAVDLMIIDE
jgi:hypothetical protein